MVDLISIGYQDPGIVPEKFLWMIRFSGTAVVIEDHRVFFAFPGAVDPHITPVDDGGYQRSGSNAVTEEIR